MTGATTAEKRRILLVFRFGLVVVALGAGAVIRLPEYALGSVPIGLLVVGAGFLVILGAGYAGMRREFG